MPPQERGTIEDVIEPFLILNGFLMRTPRGRVATMNCYKHFGLRAPQQIQQAERNADLFLDENA